MPTLGVKLTGVERMFGTILSNIDGMKASMVLRDKPANFRTCTFSCFCSIIFGSRAIEFTSGFFSVAALKKRNIEVVSRAHLPFFVNRFP